ncbi:hypothetical protein TNCV_2699661 [Trichonephila clavipes]|nr:hypothetical protein TNCV_2699661 [Trichonephila clavipes]
MYLGLEVERPRLRGSFLIGGLEGSRVYGYDDCFGDIRCDRNFSNPVPLKTSRVEGMMCVKSSMAQTSSRWCNVEVRRGRRVSSGVVFVT